jgi:hypothetical protein
MEVTYVYRAVDGQMIEGQPMAEIPLIEPPQGGEALFVGVRAHNLSSCNVTLSAALIDKGTGSVVALDRRPVSLELGDDGWLSPQRPQELSNYSNLPACPQAGLARAIDGNLYELRLVVSESDSRSATVSVDVLPSCAEAGHVHECSCECSVGYVLGGGCDAGISDSSTE